MIHSRHRPSASIALISLLLVSAMSLMLVVAMSESSVSSYEVGSNYEINQNLSYAAKACFEESVIRLESDANFAATTMVLDEWTTCSVTVVGTGIVAVTIQVDSGDYQQIFEATLEVQTEGAARNVHLLSWDQV